MKKFEVTGKIKKQKFIKILNSKTEKRAIENTIALMGSAHKAKQREIEINEVKELKE